MTSCVRLFCCTLILGALTALGLDAVRLGYEHKAEALQAARRGDLMRLAAQERHWIARLERRERRSVEALARSHGCHLEGESDWRVVSSLNLYDMVWE